MRYQVYFTEKSRNAKTGPIPVSTTTFATCPTACPLQRNGCYAEHGPLGIFWKKVTERAAGGSWGAFVKAVAALPLGTLWRHNQAGDLPGDKRTIDAAALLQLVKANAKKLGFTYTHYDVLANKANASAVRKANKTGFRINLSANNLAHADKLAASKCGPVVAMLPSSVDGAATKTVKTPEGRTVVVCPATYLDKVTCQTCKLCARARDTIVGFPAHGNAHRKASELAVQS
jgi:hypothetical protein